MCSVIFEPCGERSKKRCATAARSGSSSHASMRPPSGSAAAIESAEWPLNVPISSTRCGCAAPDEQLEEPPRDRAGQHLRRCRARRAVASESSASSASCGVVKRSAYSSMRGSTMSTSALDPRAADDRVRAVVVAHPRLALAVVVGRPDDQRRVAAADASRARCPRARRRARRARTGSPPTRARSSSRRCGRAGRAGRAASPCRRPSPTLLTCSKSPPPTESLKSVSPEKIAPRR